MAEEENQPQMRKEHRSDAIGTKFVEKTGKLEEKAAEKRHKKHGGDGDDSKDEKQQPAGGFDDTPLPQAPPGYTLKFVFHRAINLPTADVTTLSSDPYIVAELTTSIPKRHKDDPSMKYRTPTIRKKTNPEWNSEWIVANIPIDGFKMKARLYDEDPSNHDDRLGNIHIEVNHIGEDWKGFQEESFHIKKRMGSKRAYMFRGCFAIFKRNIHMSGEVFVSVEVLGRSEVKSGGRPFTVGPLNWSRHLSPMIGRLVGIKNPQESKDGEKTTEQYNFEACQIQLAGPMPESLYHRYVEFKPFVAGMFTAHSLRGRILNRALHHQHARIYNFDSSTTYGSFPSPSSDVSVQFLDLVHWDQGGRIFTYVISLDGQWRFTETGKEFGIDLLSKHTMHSDVSIYIAFSGEFLIRRLEPRQKDPEDQTSHSPTDIDNADVDTGPSSDEPSRDPALYQLVIDNDSGTYRPNKDLLHQLKDYLKRSLPGLHITTLDCNTDKEKMDAIKSEQRERKKAEGNQHTVVQGDGGSVSSSDEEELDELAAKGEGEGQAEGSGSKESKESSGIGKEEPEAEKKEKVQSDPSSEANAA